ncbi:hypothetical protein PHMEG_00011156 [Phytophthora megakarya]|uniref:Uncharacterized protein n=1 Tax=Phytophthora megakarya TaxID=4795 RepID=A0A225WC83_9STRA|nr:hypothetical protein PHMEG_00011156 [Phytophthora megakarya]
MKGVKRYLSPVNNSRCSRTSKSYLQNAISIWLTNEHPEGRAQMLAILKYHRAIFLGDRKAVPAPARCVTYDLDVGDAKTVAQCPRSVAPHLSIKV